MLHHFNTLFPGKKPVIAMIHIPALPGTPRHTEKSEIIHKVMHEVKIYCQLGIKALMIENMHDRPYLNRETGPEITAWMTRIGTEVKQYAEVPTGIQILAGANKQALAAAQAAELDFIRSECFSYAQISDEGLMNSDAGSLLRYRKMIDAENILIFTDIRKKHSSHAITSDLSMEEHARTAEFFLSDALIHTGSSTGIAPDYSELEKIKKSSSLPVLIGSGVTKENIMDFIELADGFIIGSYFKKEGLWYHEIDIQRVEKLLEKID